VLSYKKNYSFEKSTEPKQKISLNEKHESEINFSPDIPTLYLSSYYMYLGEGLYKNKKRSNFSRYDRRIFSNQIDLINIKIFGQHKKFFTKMKDLIKPINKIEYIDLPKDKITVAVHVRRGGGYDKPLIYIDKKGKKKQRRPLKFPPDEYYINQIKSLSSFFNNVPIHVHVFTDDQDPVKITNRYEKCINLSNITYSCRKTGNHHDKNIFDDLFNMAHKFDCLIRPSSNFSIIAHLLGDHRVVISPMEYIWQNDTLTISKVETYFKG